MYITVLFMDKHGNLRKIDCAQSHNRMMCAKTRRNRNGWQALLETKKSLLPSYRSMLLLTVSFRNCPVLCTVVNCLGRKVE